MASMISLRYDDGVPENGLWVDHGQGHAVIFTAPCNDWTLSKVSVCGKLNPQMGPGFFTLEVWDQDLRLMYTRTDNILSYFGEDIEWAEIEIPNLNVSGNFLVCFFEFSGVYVGVDLGNVSSGRSLVAARNPNRIDRWDLQYPQNQTDWMISAIGYSPAPEVELYVEPGEKGLVARADIFDLDGNLEGATFYVISGNETAWSEYKLIEGSKANLNFTWPGKYIRINNGTDSVGPVFAMNTVGKSPEESPYLTYSAPCLLKLEPGSEIPEISALAYFGEDGKLHGLLDIFGFWHYRSIDLLKAANPEISTGAYMNYLEENVTLAEGRTELAFLVMDVDGRMKAQEPLLLRRSPLHHYGLILEREDADEGDYFALVEVEDTGGNLVRSELKAG